jgi:hypothetical protein
MPSRQSCLSSGVTPRSFARHRRKNPAPASSDRCTPATPRPSSPTPVSVGHGDPQSPRARSASVVFPPAASTSTTAAAPLRVLSPAPLRSGMFSSAPKPAAGILPTDGPIFVSPLRTSRSPFDEECPNSDCLNFGAQSTRCPSPCPSLMAFLINECPGVPDFLLIHAGVYTELMHLPPEANIGKLVGHTGTLGHQSGCASCGSRAVTT